MTRHILILDTDFERQYQESIRYLRSKWFPDETRLRDIPAEDSVNYNITVPQHRQHNSKPIGKTVL